MVEWSARPGGTVDIKVTDVSTAWLKVMIEVKWSAVNFSVERCKFNIVKTDRLVSYVMSLAVGPDYLKSVVPGQYLSVGSFNFKQKKDKYKW